MPRRRAQDSGSPTLEQLALAELIESGDYDRHVARAATSTGSGATR